MVLMVMANDISQKAEISWSVWTVVGQKKFSSVQSIFLWIWLASQDPDWSSKLHFLAKGTTFFVSIQSKPLVNCTEEKEGKKSINSYISNSHVILIHNTQQSAVWHVPKWESWKSLQNFHWIKWDSDELFV